jgi:hypothetical protein
MRPLTDGRDAPFVLRIKASGLAPAGLVGWVG